MKQGPYVKMMDMKNHLERITIVLDRPLHPGNVGAAARAMKNMGLHRLRLVSPCDFKSDLAYWMAVSAKEILDRADVFAEVKEALSGSNLVIGTIPPDRPRFQTQVLSPRALAHRLLETHPHDRISILFGTEDNGLSNRELDFCHEFVTIPSHSDYPSLNLAQAVMVIAYEILTCTQNQETQERRPLAEVDTLEQMYEHLQQTLLSIGFLNKENNHHMMRDLRRIFGRAHLDAREVKILRGILRQTDWASGKSDKKKKLR